MDYKVLDVFRIGNNTSVTIEGKGNGLKNNMRIKDSLGITHKLLSVAMISGDNRDTTTLLIEGDFNSKVVRV